MAQRSETIELKRSDVTSLTVHRHGATITSWKHNGDELLFVSSKAVFDNKKAIRGGVPVVFPNFGPWSLGPQHGFARTSQWSVLEQPHKTGSGEVKASLQLTDTAETRSMWADSQFSFVYSVVLGENQLTTSVSIENTGSSPFDFTTLLHTYFRTPDVTRTTVSGLGGLHYVDKVRGSCEHTEDRDPLTVTEFTDRVYRGASKDHLLTNMVGGRTLCLHKENLPDTVVWNPWAEKAKAMSDFGDEEYPNMLCVEAGAVSERVKLAPGAKFNASQTVTVQQA